MTTTTKSQGTVINWGGSPMGECRSFSMPGADTPEIDIGSFADTVVKTRAGKPMGGVFTFKVNFNPDDTSQSNFEADVRSGVERTVQIVYPEGTVNTITATGRALNFVPFSEAKVNGIIIGEMTIKFTSMPVES
jgi:hypothetical protein